MRGIVLSYDRKQKKGLISGDDGNRYTFSTEDWNLSLNPEKGLKVDFEREGKKAKDFVLIEEKKQESFVTQVIFVFVLLGFVFVNINGEKETPRSCSREEDTVYFEE